MTIRVGIPPAWLLLLGLAVTTSAAWAQDIREERVELSEGSAIIDGTITGREIIDYKVAAGAGDRLVATMTTNNLSNYFNILPPGETAVAIFNGSIEENRFEGMLPESGEYTFRVYLFRNAARRNETATFQLRVTVTPPPADYADGLSGGPDFWEVTGVSAGHALNMRSGPSTHHEVNMQFDNGARLRNLGCTMTGEQRWCEVALPDDPGARGWVAGRYLRESAYVEGSAADATVGDTGYHATGEIPCAIGSGAPFSACEFGVVRKGGGTAIVTVFLPSGDERIIHFQSGEPLMAESDQALGWDRRGDLTVLKIGDGERYQVPDAVIYGG